MAIAYLSTQLSPQLIKPENFQPYGQVIKSFSVFRNWEKSWLK